MEINRITGNDEKMNNFGLEHVKNYPQLKKLVIYVNFSFMVGIIADLVEAIEMMFFIIGEVDVLKLDMIKPGFILMIGWTILMCWGILKPIERRSILLITAIPVASSFGVYNMLLANLGANSFTLEAIFNFIGTSIFISGYFIARKVAKEIDLNR